MTRLSRLIGATTQVQSGFRTRFDHCISVDLRLRHIYGLLQICCMVILCSTLDGLIGEELIAEINGHQAIAGEMKTLYLYFFPSRFWFMLIHTNFREVMLLEKSFRVFKYHKAILLDGSIESLWSRNTSENNKTRFSCSLFERFSSRCLVTLYCLYTYD